MVSQKFLRNFSEILVCNRCRKPIEFIIIILIVYEKKTKKRLNQMTVLSDDPNHIFKSAIKLRFLSSEKPQKLNFSTFEKSKNR